MIYDKRYVRADDHGVLRVGQTRVSLDSVAYAFREGHSAETIRDQYPALSLEEIHGAMAFCLANRAEVEEYLARQERRWEELRAEAERNPSPVVERLLALRAAALRDKS